MGSALWIVRMAVMYTGIALHMVLIVVWSMASTTCKEARKAVEKVWHERNARRG